MKKVISTLLCSAMLCSCAVIYEGRYDYDDGWRVVYVLETGVTFTKLPAPSVDCRPRVLAVAVSRAKVYAYVRYFRNFAPRHGVFLIPEGGGLQPGQRAYAKITDCSEPLVPHGKP